MIPNVANCLMLLYKHGKQAEEANAMFNNTLIRRLDEGGNTANEESQLCVINLCSFIVQRVIKSVCHEMKLS